MAVGLHSLPVFVRLEGRPVMLIGEGDAADAKRRLLERAGAVIVGEEAKAALAVVAMDDPDETVARLKARGVLVNAVDRADLCDFTLPAIVDRSPVIVAVGTGGVSAGLAAALRQRLETILPIGLGGLALDLQNWRDELRERWPDAGERRRMLAIGMTPGALLDPLGQHRQDDVWQWILTASESPLGAMVQFKLASSDPDDLTLRQARALAQADRVLHAPGVPAAILDRARADAPRIVSETPPLDPGDGLTVYLEMAR